MSDAAYLSALKLLARRELSEAQVRQRLARRGHAPEDVDAAVARLLADRSIDDTRTAAAIARTQTAVRGRGRHRVLRQIEQAGIAREIARAAVADVFGTIDADALLDGALDRRLRGREVPGDEAGRARLYRFLVGQGFEADRVRAALDRRRRR